jgi:hypothetical protein
MLKVCNNEDVIEYPLEEEDCILVHGLENTSKIMTSKQKLIQRISNYQYSFKGSESISLNIDKKINIFHLDNNNSSRLLVDRILRIEKRLYSVSIKINTT